MIKLELQGANGESVYKCEISDTGKAPTLVLYRGKFYSRYQYAETHAFYRWEEVTELR